MAKLCKVKVNEFAIGFGPVIWKRQGKERNLTQKPRKSRFCAKTRRNRRAVAVSWSGSEQEEDGQQDEDEAAAAAAGECGG